MHISKHQVVSIHYTLTNDQGEVLDKSSGTEPLTYIQGCGNIIPGLENALEGKKVGDKLQVTIAPEDAYGHRDERMIQVVPKSEFGVGTEIEEGMQFNAQTEQGTIMVTVVENRANEVVLDGNHPLAGVNLHFAVEVTDIRSASAEEISHGHVHSGGCHH